MSATVVIIGASKCLGQEFARRRRCMSCWRTSDGRLEIEHLDITHQDEVDALRTRLDGRTFDLP